MKKTKCLVFSIITVMSTTLGGITTFAATPTHTPPANQSVNVSYDSTLVVAGSDFSISIPKDIQFTNSVKSENVDVNLCNKNGTSYTGNQITVTANVQSTNGYKLEDKEGANVLDSIPYTINYNGQDMAGTASQKLGDLTQAATTIKGTASLPKTSVPRLSGTYNDTLTYSFTVA